MKYTKPITFNELKEKIQTIAKEKKFSVEVYKYKKDDYSSDNKVTTRIVVKSNKCELEFYDYKATNYYSNNNPSPTKLRQGEYSYHVQSNDALIETIFEDLFE